MDIFGGLLHIGGVGKKIPLFPADVLHCLAVASKCGGGVSVPATVFAGTLGCSPTHTPIGGAKQTSEDKAPLTIPN